MIRADAYAKINLVLDITGKREDGYHELKSIMQELSLHDHVDLEVNPDPYVKLFVTGGDGIPSDASNIAVKTANLIRETFRISEGVIIHISKRIPAEAGLGGGSADAAAVIRGMNVLFGLGMTTEQMMELGVKIGADVPYCILGGTALAEGIGEKLTVLPAMPGVPVLLVKPVEGVYTQKAYEVFDRLSSVTHPDTDGCVSLLNGKPESSSAWLRSFGNHCGNVLEPVAEKKIPQITEIKKVLTDNGAEFALMTGSGSTVFGVFAENRTAWEAAEEVKRHFALLPEEDKPEVILTYIRKED